MTTTLETGRIQFGNRDIQFKVQRSPRRQTVGVIVDANGVTLNAPAQLEFSALEQIARTRAAWIVTKQRRLETLSAAPATVKQFESGESFRYLGRQYRLKRLKPNTPASAKLRGKHIEVHASDALEARALVETWYKSRAAERLPERVAVYCKRLGITEPPILIRDQRQRWGSCNSKGELRINWRIIMAPMRLVDYVIAHELCHLKESNHSRAFWKLLRQVIGDWEERREELAVQGRTYSI
jgi:predicted metal-dependent hydrolase